MTRAHKDHYERLIEWTRCAALYSPEAKEHLAALKACWSDRETAVHALGHIAHYHDTERVAATCLEDIGESEQGE